MHDEYKLDKTSNKFPQTQSLWQNESMPIYLVNLLRSMKMKNVKKRPLLKTIDWFEERKDWRSSRDPAVNNHPSKFKSARPQKGENSN
jgi:hypothetical protein